ncbi:MAG: GWxTD domain-containing protein [Lentisphaeria bacterium]|nr:GWxTD domain-containing protein [Candidatus Neomarinimicrobiota bacterium]MCF7842099.1 GWxTD domain-containing protein [Lentisphaeria bacterium]
MFYKRLLTTYLLLIFSVTLTLQAQTRQEEELIGLPEFSFIGITSPMADREHLKVDIQVSVPYNQIQFIRQEGQFHGKYEVGITFSTPEDIKITGRIVKRDLYSERYEETRDAHRSDIITEPFILPATDVRVIIRVTDLDTRKTRFLDDSRDYSEFYKSALVLGDVGIIRSQYEENSREHTVFWGNQLPEPLDTIKFQARLLGEQGPYDIQYRLLKEETPVYYLSSKINTPMAVDTLLNLIMPTQKMSFGQYSLELSVRDGEGTTVASRAQFRVHWRGVSGSIQNLPLAIEQLRYIASEKQIKQMLKARDEEKRQLFLQFWREKDPTPNTVENELMDEYYRRVSYANEHFSSIREGWLTDMGAIYILFGPPNEIERRPFEMDMKPYEIWYYFDIDQQFIFVDMTGFGEYRLSQPYRFLRDWEYHP